MGMKFGQKRAFEKHLIEAAPQHFAPIYLLITQDDYERKVLARKLSTALLGELSSDEHHCIKLNGAQHTIRDLIQELGSMNFFAKKRVVIFENAQELKKEDTAKLEEYFSHPDPAVFLVLTASAINRATRFYKQSEKVGVILDIEPEKPWEKEASLIEAVSAWFKKEGVRLQPGVAQALVKSVNNDQSLLNQEMEKIICYLGDHKEFSLDDLEIIGAGQTIQNAWQLGDAIFSRRGGEALQISRQLLDNGEPLIGLLRALRTQFQTRLMGATAQPEEVQSRFPYLRGQMLHKQIQQARQYGADSCRKGLLLIDEAELRAKNSAMTSDLIIESLIFNLVST